jgi:hypothetical protein
MRKILIIAILFSFLVLLLVGESLALTKEEASHILKDLIKTEVKILEIREAPLQGFWEVVMETGQERRIIYIDKNVRFIIHGTILDRQIKRNLTLDRLKDFQKAVSRYIDWA